MPPSIPSAPDRGGHDADALAKTRALLASGRREQARREVEAMLGRQPLAGEWWQLSAEIATAEGRLEDARHALEHAASLTPRDANLWLVSARFHLAMNESDSAISAFDRALVLKPDSLEALVGLSRLLAQRRLWPAAITLSQRAVVTSGGHRMAHLELAKYQLDAGYTDQALATLNDYLSKRPGDADILAASGQVLIRLARHDEAMTRYRAALAIQPGCRLAADGLTASLNRIGDIDAASQLIADKQARWPNDPEIRSQALFLLNYALDLNPQQIAAAHIDWGHWITAKTGRNVRMAAGRPNFGRRIRVGYLSADFCRHSVAYFLEPVLAHHDRHTFEVFCYSVTARPDDITERLATHADHWRNVVESDDELLTRQIEADNIDLLVDLGGHTAGNRLGVFARRAAPVQVTWLGYPNTTGLAEMDFRITDEVADPPSSADALTSETLIRIPEGFLCYRPPALTSVAVSPLATTPDRPFTFGSFNHIAKINDVVVSTWTAILSETPGSRLLLKAAGLDSQVARNRLRDAFERAGLADESRLLLRGNTPDISTHFATYSEIDLALDPFPYNGTTTTCDALWAGVPVLTLRGDRHAARVGASLLQAIGRPDLVSESSEAYITKAVELARNPDVVRRWRNGIATSMRQSPLMNEPAFTRKLESAYRQMIAARSAK